MNKDNGTPKMPPPNERRILIPGRDQLPPGLGGPAPGQPGAHIRSTPIDTSQPPVRAVVTFYEPPQAKDVAPHGVFWQTPAGLALSPFVEPPCLVLEEGVEPPEGAQEIPMEGDPDVQSDQQAPNIHADSGDES